MPGIWKWHPRGLWCPGKEPNPNAGGSGRLLGGSDVQAESRNSQSDDKLGMSVQAKGTACADPPVAREVRQGVRHKEGGEKGAEGPATCSGSLLAWPRELDRVWALSCGLVRGSKEV